MTEFGLAEVQALITKYCAPLVNRLDFEITDIRKDGASYLWRPNNEVLRAVDDANKIVAGQATMAVADTVSFLTICAINAKMCNCTTVDMNTNFLRPLFSRDIIVDVTGVGLGRNLITQRIDFDHADTPKIAVTATSIFTYIR